MENIRQLWVFDSKSAAIEQTTDFTKAIESAVPAVVHKKKFRQSKSATIFQESGKQWIHFEDFYDFFGRGFILK